MTMFAFHKPKTFRSADGCCICKAKSSSSRFTDSKRYEGAFEKCFKMDGEIRSGEICNACVLLVKRFQRLPSNTTKHWNHVVDARSGPGLKSLVRTKGGKICKPKEFVEENEGGAVTPEKFKKKHVYKKRYNSKKKIAFPVLPVISRPSWRKQPKDNIRRIPEGSVGLLEGLFIDSDMWTEEQTCCGTVFRGPHGEMGIDVRYVYPCGNKRACDKTAAAAAATAEVDFDSSCSAASSTAALKLKLTATDLSEKSTTGVSSGSSDAGCDEGFFDKAAGSPSSVYTGASTPPYIQTQRC